MSTPPRRTRLDLLIVGACALLGAALLALGLTWYLNRDDRWVRLVAPAGDKPVAIAAVDRGLHVYVRTESGAVHLCTGGTWRDACRPVADSEVPTVKVPPRWRTCRNAFPEPPPAPGAVVDALEAGQCSEVRTYSKIVITADGGLWQWRRTFSWVHSFALASGILVGLGLGAGIGWLINRMRRLLA